MQIDQYMRIYSPLGEIPVKGLDEKKTFFLRALGIRTVGELLYYFPRSYDDRTNIKTIDQLRADEYAVVKAFITRVTAPPTRSGLKMVKAVASDGTGVLDLVWFQMPYLRKSLKTNEEYVFIGQVKRGYTFQMVNPEFKLLAAQQKMQDGEILPIYGSTKDLTQNMFRKIVANVLATFVDDFEENIPTEILEKYGLPGRREALTEIHFPSAPENLERAKKRFAMEELLVLEMGILEKRWSLDQHQSGLYTLDDRKDLVKSYLATLDFALTKAQKRVITDIYRELSAGKIVNRLLQGDVGSGKTVVSVILLLYMVENGYQGVLMAPTEILAAQHYLSVRDIFADLGVEAGLLTGSSKGKAREALLRGIRDGDTKIVIGTHALIEENVEFHKLGLIIIDEQHRFGVVQRKKLRDKGFLANLVVMSATPIPRSLALSIYGDLDVSVLDELPPGRLPVRTKWISNLVDAKLMYEFIDRKLSRGKQAFFVAPLIEESEKLSAKSVEELRAEVEKHLPGYRLGILHGRMTGAEKDAVMASFKKKELDILVSTTVIEVGVDIPNAAVIVITNAERFGLSALHQLRGRVGRSKEQAYCFLVSYTDNAVSKSRLTVMEETTDGFKIAEEDLRLRKAGEIFGVRQSGFSDLRFIDIIHDVKTIELVKQTCEAYLKAHQGRIDNPWLTIDIEQKFRDN